jgi:hypothetical protein
MADEGKQLVQCLRAVSAYSKELNAMVETLNELLVKEFGCAKDLPCKISGEFVYSDRKDESEWLWTDIAYSLPLMGKKKIKKTAEMHLGYQISLMGDGMSFLGNEEPLLHIVLWGGAIDFANDEYMGYPLELEDDQPYRILNGRLIVWGEQSADWRQNGFVFSLRLLTLDSSQALIDRVIKPALALIKSVPVTTALPDDMPGLILYSDESVFRGAIDEDAKVE